MNTKNQKFIMSPGYITGLAQTDGSFFCSIILSTKHLFGIQFRPKFSITADLNSIHVLEQIKIYFGCGDINVNKKNHSAEYVVSKLTDLMIIIIPHFKNHPVFCAKLHAFNLFAQIVTSLFEKNKRTLEGRRELLKLALSMNATTNRKKERIDLLFSKLQVIEDKDKTLIPYTIDLINTFITDDILSGIIDGDGSFYISFQKKGKIVTGFSITTDNLSRPLLEAIQQKLQGIGSIRKGSKNELIFIVTGLNQINDILIPFMGNNKLLSERALHYEKFKEVSLKLKNNKPLTLEDKIKIVDLYYDMNKDGKRRLLTKSEYLEQLKSTDLNLELVNNK